MDDKNLQDRFSALCRGDRQALAEIYEMLGKPVYTLLCRILGEEASAEDILQDIFLQLYTRPPQGVKNPRAYIFKTARNAAIDELRKKKPEALDETLPQREDCEQTICSKADIERALAALPLSERETLTLHINAGLKFREIAQMTQTPLGTVLWRYNHAVKALRIRLSE